jgi:hypothetical protein
VETEQPKPAVESAESLVGKGLEERIAAAKKPAAPAPAGAVAGADKPAFVERDADAPLQEYLSKEDAEKMVNDRVQAALKEERGRTTEERTQSDVRERFIRKNMMDLPVFAQNTMPKTADLGKLATAEQALRKEISEWVKTVPGYKPINVGGGNPGGVSPLNFHAANNVGKPGPGSQTSASLVASALDNPAGR